MRRREITDMSFGIRSIIYRFMGVPVPVFYIENAEKDSVNWISFFGSFTIKKRGT